MAIRVTVFLLIVAWLVCVAADISDMCKAEVLSLSPEERADLFDPTTAEDPSSAPCEDTSIYQDCDRVVLDNLCTVGPHYAHFCCRSCLDAAQVERFGPHTAKGVKAPLVAEVEHEALVVQRGEDVTLTCSFSGYPMPDVGWISPNGTPIAPGTKYHITVNQEDTPLVRTLQSNLCVRNFSRDDAGRYVCLGVTDHDHTTATINLKDPAGLHLVRRSPDQIVGAGEPVFLECVVKAARPPTITWTYNDISLAPFGRRTLSRKFPDWDYDLFTVFANTTEEDEEGLVTEYSSFCVNSSLHAHTGYYACHARNEEGTRKWGINVSVIKEDKSPSLSFTGAKGGHHQGTASVNCYAVGVPEGLALAWTKDTAPLEDSPKYTTTIEDTSSLTRTLRLDVHNLTLADAGHYTCTATAADTTTAASVLLHFDSHATFTWKNIDSSPADVSAPSASCKE